MLACALSLLVFALGLPALVDTNPSALVLGGLLLRSAAFGALFMGLARVLSLGAWLGIAGGFIGFLALSPLAPPPRPASAEVGTLLLLFIGQLALLVGGFPDRQRQIMALACGLIGVLCHDAGLAAPLALVGWQVLDRNRRQVLTLVGNAALVVLSLGLIAIRHTASGSSFGPALVGQLAWPFSNFPAAFVLWAPAAACLWRAWLTRFEHNPSPLLPICILWVLLQTIVLAALGPADAGVASEWSAAGLVINAACLFFLGQSSRRNLVLGAFWLIIVGNTLLHPAPGRIPPPITPAANLPLSPVLPPASAAPSAFQRDAFPPDLAGRDGLPALGTWAASSPTATGTWTSAPLLASAALLQFRVNGTLQPPATSLVLRTADGHEIAPLAAGFTATDRWKRVNFPAPAGSFQIVARDNSESDWLAFTTPVVISRFSWLVGKFVRPWVAAAFALAGGIVAILALFRIRSTLPAVQPAPSEAWPLVPWLALVAYAVFFFQHIDPVAGPNDSGGYLISAKALASGHLGPAPRPIWGAAAGETDLTPYLTPTFQPHASGRAAPEYPVGLPLIFAALGCVFPMEHAVPAVILIQLVLGVLFTRQFAKAVGLSAGWDWLAAGIIALSPVYLFQGLQPQSDSPALVWCTAAVWWAWASRERVWLALPAGLATALAVLIRPSNALVVFPVLVALTGAWRQLGLWILAGLPVAAWLGWYNQTLYGSALMTGYGEVSGNFGWHFVPLTLRSYLIWLPLLLTPLIALAAAGPWLREVRLRVRLMLVVWAAVFPAFYASYWCTWDHWYNMRFVLPAAPALVVLALFTARAIAERSGLALFRPSPYWRGFALTWLLGLLLAAQLIADASGRRVLYWMNHNSVNAAGPRWLAGHVPPNAVVFARHATNSLFYYTDLTFVRSDHPKAQSPEFFADIARTGRPIYAFNYWWEGHGAEGGPNRGEGRPNLPGNWTRIATLWGDELHVWQWSQPTRPPDGK